MNKIRILFLPSVDADNTNAQSLNTREIALRLDPERIESTLWFEQEPDARLKQRPGIRLLQLPSRRKTPRILREQLSGYDIIAYTDYSPASYLFVHLPQLVRHCSKTVFHSEAPSAQIVNPPRVFDFLYKGIFPNCDVYTAITDHVGRDVARITHAKVSHILPVGVNTSFFTPPPFRNEPRSTVLFVGTLMERKGPQYVLDAAARFPQARFRIIGADRGGFENVLREKIQRLQLRNVTLEGPKGQSQVRAAMQESDIFLLPSRLEGMPKVTLEAAASGLPCIVFSDYETPSVVDGVTGYQITTIEEMFERLTLLLSDSLLRQNMGEAARKHAELFDWDVIAKLWQNAYLQIAAANA